MRGIIMSIHWGAPLPLFLFRRIIPLAFDRGEDADSGVIEFHGPSLI